MLFPSGIVETYHDIFTRSLAFISHILKHDMYSLNASGCPIDKVPAPELGPLALARYSYVYWVDHLYDFKPTYGESLGRDDDLQDSGTIQTFFEKKYLYWLKALSLLHSMLEGVVAIRKIGELVSTKRLIYTYNLN